MSESYLLDIFKESIDLKFFTHLQMQQESFNIKE